MVYLWSYFHKKAFHKHSTVSRLSKSQAIPTTLGLVGYSARSRVRNSRWTRNSDISWIKNSVINLLLLIKGTILPSRKLFYLNSSNIIQNWITENFEYWSNNEIYDRNINKSFYYHSYNTYTNLPHRVLRARFFLRFHASRIELSYIYNRNYTRTTLVRD